MLFTTILKYGNHYWNTMFFRFLLSGFLLYLIMYFIIYISNDYLRAFVLVTFSLTAFFIPSILTNSFIRKKYFSEDFDRFSVPIWVEDHYKNIHTVYNCIYAIKGTSPLQDLQKNLDDYEKAMLVGIENTDKYVLKNWVIPSIPKLDLMMIRLHLLGIIMLYVAVFSEMNIFILELLVKFGFKVLDLNLYENKIKSILLLISIFLTMVSHIFFSWNSVGWNYIYDPENSVLKSTPGIYQKNSEDNQISNFSSRKRTGYRFCLVIFGFAAAYLLATITIILFYLPGKLPIPDSLLFGIGDISSNNFGIHFKIFMFFSFFLFSFSFTLRATYNIMSESVIEVKKFLRKIYHFLNKSS